MRNVLFVCLTALSFSLFGDEEPIQTEELIVQGEKIHAICSFDQADYFTTFSSQGEFLWEVPFASKIISWKKEDAHLYILSKARNGLTYFLSAIEAANGKMIWEKSILAPSPTTNAQVTEN